MTPHLVGGALNKCEEFNYARKREGVEKCGTKTNWSVWQRNYLGKAGWEILWEHSEELIGVNRLPRYSSSLPLPTVRTANSSTQDQTNFLLFFSAMCLTIYWYKFSTWHSFFLTLVLLRGFYFQTKGWALKNWAKLDLKCSSSKKRVINLNF